LQRVPCVFLRAGPKGPRKQRRAKEKEKEKEKEKRRGKTVHFFEGGLEAEQEDAIEGLVMTTMTKGMGKTTKVEGDLKISLDRHRWDQRLCSGRQRVFWRSCDQRHWLRPT